MRMRRLRMPLILGVLAVGLTPLPVAAQSGRLVPYHMLIGAGHPQTTGARAQTPFVPYFGKNRVRYDNFKWQIYETDHFNIFFYADLEPHLERIAGYAESACTQMSAALQYG